MPVEQATERNWTPRKGWRTSRVWMGGSKEITSLAAQIQKLKGAYVNMTVAPQDGGVSRRSSCWDPLCQRPTRTGKSVHQIGTDAADKAA